MRFSALFSTPMGAKRLPIVPFDSSAARMPFPGAAIALAVATSSAAYSVKEAIFDGVKSIARRKVVVVYPVTFLGRHAVRE